jgi:hypothetical protein
MGATCMAVRTTGVINAESATERLAALTNGNSSSSPSSSLTAARLIAVACARGRNEIEPQRLGYWLRQNKGRVVDGCKIIGELELHSKQMLWSLTDKRES